MNIPDHTLLAVQHAEQWLAMARPGTTRAELSYILAMALAALDERGMNPMLGDAVASTDNFIAALTTSLADATTSFDALLPMQLDSLRNEDSSSQDAWAADAAMAMADAVASADAAAGYLQNYALDPSYFSGDYATTQIL